MIIYYSGNSSRDALAEVAIRDLMPAIMMTFYDFYDDTNKATGARFHKHRMNNANIYGRPQPKLPKYLLPKTEQPATSNE